MSAGKESTEKTQQDNAGVPSSHSALFASSGSSQEEQEDVNRNACDNVVQAQIAQASTPNYEGDPQTEANSPAPTAATASRPTSSTPLPVDQVASGEKDYSTKEVLFSFTDKPPPTTAFLSNDLLRDSDSDVLSLGDCTKVPNSEPLFTEPTLLKEAAKGESCFSVLYRPHQLAGQVGDLDTDTADGGQTDVENSRGDPVLNSLDPFPFLRLLSGPSRSLLKKYFDQNPPVELSKDHTTVAFSEEQVYNLIRVACDETAHASFEMMSGLLQRASRLPGGSVPQPQSQRPQPSSRFRAATPLPSLAGSSAESNICPVTSDSESYTSGAIQTGESDIGFLSNTDLEVASIERSHSNLGSSGPQTPEASGSSQERITLASLQKEAFSEYCHARSGVKSTRTVAVGDPPPKRTRMSRPDKIFKESYFRKIEWARVFVSGPMNPLENPHCFYCQICCRNVSIYGKGAAEVKRHFSSREHFRRDQKWRYVHLRKTDPITGNVSHFVRDKRGNLLGHLELEQELPKFIKEELVEIGDKLPFYEDFKASRVSVTPGTSRSYTQLCLIGDYLKTGGNFAQLRSIWTNVGTFTNHQSLFSDFDWSDERITVSTRISPVVAFFVVKLSSYSVCKLCLPYL